MKAIAMMPSFFRKRSVFWFINPKLYERQKRGFDMRLEKAKAGLLSLYTTGLIKRPGPKR